MSTEDFFTWDSYGERQASGKAIPNVYYTTTWSEENKNLI